MFKGKKKLFLPKNFTITHLESCNHNDVKLYFFP